MFTVKYPQNAFAVVLMILFSASYAVADSSLHENARKEGNVLVYSALNVSKIVPLQAAFEKRYPGVKLEHLRLSGPKLMQRVLAEGLAGKHSADVVLFNTGPMSVLSQKGLLAKYDPLEKERDVLDPMFKHPESLWTTVYMSLDSIVYNTRMVAPKDVPRHYTDLLRPQWKDKIGINTTKYMFTYGILDFFGKEKGMDFLRKLQLQDPVPRAGGTLTAQLVGAGEFPLGFSVNVASTENVRRSGAPIDWAHLDDPAYGDAEAAGVLAKSPHPNAARLLVNFLLSREGQAKISELEYIAVRKDVAEPGTSKIDRSKLRVIDPIEGNRIDFYMGLMNDLFVKAR